MKAIGDIGDSDVTILLVAHFAWQIDSMCGLMLDKATPVFCVLAACIVPSYYQSSQQGKFPGQFGTDFFTFGYWRMCCLHE